MTTWTRDTRWRQGSLVRREDLQALDISLEPEDILGLVISHDCDVANDNMDVEPDVEIILLEPLQEIGNGFAYGKNPRCLHFSIAGGGGETRCFQAKAHKKRRLPKNQFADCQPLPDLALSDSTREILQRWLACRYKRHALPNALVERFDKLYQLIIKQAKRQTDALVGVWIAFDPDDEADDETPYELSIYFVYSADDPAAYESTTAVAEAVKDRADKCAQEPDGGGAIYLAQCQAVSEEAFTLWDMRHTIELKLEYLSYRGEAPGPMMP